MNRNRTVSIDARWLRGGVGTYAINVIRELRAIDASLRIHVLTRRDSALEFARICDDVGILSAPAFGLSEQLTVSRAAGDGSVLHCTHYNAPLLRRGPLIVTIADVTPLLNPEYHVSWKSRICGAFLLRSVARRADHIITVSDYSKRRIVEVLGTSADKITVAHNGVGSTFHPMGRGNAIQTCWTDLGIKAPFLLYVGLIRPHKNVGALLRAFARLIREYDIEHRLLLIGDGHPGAVQEVELLVRDLSLLDRVVTVPFVKQKTLLAAYCATEALIMPSFEEGFGLPVLEAMACGTPVLCSATAALPEVAGDAAAYFDPHDANDIAEKAAAVLFSPSLLTRMRTSSLSRAAQFTWADSARIHHSVYQRFLD